MSTSVKVKKGMNVRINPNEPEGRLYEGRIFVIDSAPRKVGGTMVSALNNLDGTRFSPGYDLAMIHVLPTEIIPE